MRAYVIAMTPRRIRLLIDGKIKKDVKINCPRGAMPFKCYVYCPIKKYNTSRSHIKAMRETGQEYDEWKGNIIAEFVCTEMRPVLRLPPLSFFDETQLSIEEYNAMKLKAASKMRTLTITDLKVYDTPVPLSGLQKTDGSTMDSLIGAFTPVFTPVEEM